MSNYTIGQRIVKELSRSQGGPDSIFDNYNKIIEQDKPITEINEEIAKNILAMCQAMLTDQLDFGKALVKTENAEAMRWGHEGLKKADIAFAIGFAIAKYGDRSAHLANLWDKCKVTKGV